MNGGAGLPSNEMAKSNLKRNDLALPKVHSPLAALTQFVKGQSRATFEFSSRLKFVHFDSAMNFAYSVRKNARFLLEQDEPVR